MEYALGWDTAGTNSVMWGKINGVTLGWDTAGTNSVMWGKINGAYLGMGHWG